MPIDEFPMSAAPVLDGEIASQVRWYRRFFAPVNRAIDSVGVGDTSWIEPDFLNGWAHYGKNDWSGAAYIRRRGIVYLSGLVKGTSTAPDPMFVLPAGFRPKYGTIFTAWAGPGYARLDVRANGEVLVQTYIGGDSTYVSLCNVRFFAEQ